MTELERYSSLYSQISKNDVLMYAGHLLRRAARLWPEKIAVICENQEIRYHELFKQSLNITYALHAAGIRTQHRVMLIYENSIDYYVAYYGIWQTGAVVVPVNNMLNPEQLKHIISSAKPHGLIISSALYEKMSEAIQTIPLIIKGSDFEKIYKGPVFDEDNLPEQDPNALTALLYTSGTTGNPKGVMLSSKNILINCIQGGARFTATENDRSLAALPLFHSYSQNICLWLSMVLGITCILVPRIERKLLLEGLAHKPTAVLGIPQLYGLFCLMKTAPFDHVRYFISGGDALPNRTRMWFELIYGRKLCNGYGLTETSPFLSIDFDDMIKPPETVGKPLTHVTIEIRSDTGTVLQDGNVGILWIRGPNVMIGYYDNPTATHESIVDGWFNTGDLALISPEGKIVICGREKDLIKSKGIKVYPQEIENVLMNNPRVLGAAVIGEKRENDEVPVAYIMSKEPFDGLEEELRLQCISKLATYEVPRSFMIRTSLPMTATTKIDKKALRNEHDRTKT